jgi:hypothetical protein
MLVYCLAYSSILKMEATCSSETPVDFHHFFLNSHSGRMESKLGPLVTSVTSGLLYLPWGIVRMENLVRVRARVWQVKFMVDKVALGQVFSEYFGFPCQNRSFHQLLHHHHNHPAQLEETLRRADHPSKESC